MSPEFPKTFDVGITLPRQNKLSDCWADCISGVFGWLKMEPVPSQDDVRTAFVGNADAPLPLGYVKTVTERFGVTCSGGFGRVPPEFLLREVTNGRPVLVALAWMHGYVFTAGGHFILVTGFRTFTSRFLIQDPWNGPADLSYAEIALAYGLGQWVETYYGFENNMPSVAGS